MQHFDNIINNLIKIHKDSKTQYSSTTMFPSANDLSFAISRLMDAQRTFTSESFEMKELSPEQYTLWASLRDEMTSETANDLALCFIKNTPFSNTPEETKQVKDLFYKTMFTCTDNEDLSNTFTNIFFGESEAKMPKMRDRD